MADPKLAIITVLHNSAAAFQTLWDGLAAQHHAHWRLLAIDNASTDGSRATLRGITDPRLATIANPTNVGFARATNQGLRQAIAEGAQRCLLLNPDTTMAPGFLGDLLAAWQNHDWPVVAPRIMRLENPAEPWYAGGHFDYGWTFQNRHDIDDPFTPRNVDFASFCCLGITKATLHRIGLLDERFFLYWEDADYCLRLKAAGIPIRYLPDPSLLHEGGASSGGERSPRAMRHFLTSYTQLLRKHFGVVTAVNTIQRTLRREHARQPPPPLIPLATALLRGLLIRPRPEPRLPDGKDAPGSAGEQGGEGEGREFPQHNPKAE